jgi:hypothetical protein
MDLGAWVRKLRSKALINGLEVEKSNLISVIIAVFEVGHSLVVPELDIARKPGDGKFRVIGDIVLIDMTRLDQLSVAISRNDQIDILLVEACPLKLDLECLYRLALAGHLVVVHGSNVPYPALYTTSDGAFTGSLRSGHVSGHVKLTTVVVTYRIWLAVLYNPEPKTRND